MREIIDAILANDPTRLRELLAGGANIDDSLDEDGLTLLQLAAFLGKAKCVRLLLELGADVNAPDKDGCTPLYLAAMEGNAECVKILLDSGANIEAQNAIRSSAMHTAEVWGHTECVRLLEAAAAKKSTEQGEL